MHLVSVYGAHTTPSYNARISNSLTLKIKKICQFDFVLKNFESKIENIMLKLIENQNSDLSSHPFENIMFKIDEHHELRKYCTVLKKTLQRISIFDTICRVLVQYYVKIIYQFVLICKLQMANHTCRFETKIGLQCLSEFYSPQ